MTSSNRIRQCSEGQPSGKWISSLALLAISLLAAVPASAQAIGNGYEDTRPKILQKVGIDQRLDQQLPLEVRFRDETGRDVRLGEYFGKRPVIFALVYYQCPMLCTLVMNGLTSALTVVRFNAGREFDVVAVSIDPRETPAMASAKKRTYLNRYNRPGTEDGWHFLTGDQAAIDSITQAAGFRYAWDPDLKQFAHASAIMLITPEGRISQYYYGIEYGPNDLRLGLVEASKNKIGNAVDQVLLYCYHYDPATGKYGAVAMKIMRLAAGATVLVLGMFVFIMVRRDHESGGGAPRAAS